MNYEQREVAAKLKSRNLKHIILITLSFCVSSGLTLASEEYVTNNTTVLNISEADIAEAVALGASTLDVLPDRNKSFAGMAVTNYGGEEAIAVNLSTTVDNGSSFGASAAKANGGSDYLFKLYGGFQW